MVAAGSSERAGERLWAGRATAAAGCLSEWLGGCRLVAGERRTAKGPAALGTGIGEANRVSAVWALQTTSADHPTNEELASD